MHPGQMQPGPGWQLGPRPGAPGPGITRLWLVVAVAVLVAALVISIVLAVTSG
jgi:hypothetical protein